MNLAVFGGTFNPIHRGHLLVTENAVRVAALDKILFMPCARPPHKSDEGLAPDEHRLAMVRAAIAGNPTYELSDLEIRRGGASYAIETLRELKKLHPDANLFFIVGSDNFQTLGDWRELPALLQLCTFLVIERPGCPIQLPSDSGKPLPDLRYQICPGPTQEVSSSQIRQLLAEGKNVSPFVVPTVYDYIRQQRLYSAPS